MFDLKQYLDVARHLAGEPTDEARLRAAVSRAYYAVFLMIREKVHIVGKERLHEQAKTAIAAKSSAHGGMFQTLRDMRVHADYVLKAGDPGYDPAYDDWRDNWKNAEWCCASLIPFIEQW